MLGSAQIREPPFYTELSASLGMKTKAWRDDMFDLLSKTQRMTGPRCLYVMIRWPKEAPWNEADEHLLGSVRDIKLDTDIQQIDIYLRW